jgi:hypothetical protein
VREVDDAYVATAVEHVDIGTQAHLKIVWYCELPVVRLHASRVAAGLQFTAACSSEQPTAPCTDTGCTGIGSWVHRPLLRAELGV